MLHIPLFVYSIRIIIDVSGISLIIDRMLRLHIAFFHGCMIQILAEQLPCALSELNHGDFRGGRVTEYLVVLHMGRLLSLLFMYKITLRLDAV